MDFSNNREHETIREAIGRVCAASATTTGWRKDRDGGFPHEFHRPWPTAAGSASPCREEYGGAGLGITEAAVMMQTIAESGAGLSGASAVHMNIFGLHPVVVFGTEEQKRRMLPPLIAGKREGLLRGDRAQRRPQHHQAQDPRRARRRPLHLSTARRSGSRPRRWPTRCCCWRAPRRSRMSRSRPTGLTLFYTDLDRSYVEVREIDKMGRKAVDSNQLFIDGLPVPVEDRIGEEGRGFEYILHGMNPERILIAAEAVGLGRAALARAAKYAKERIVFDRPIGQNQGIQHPLARVWMELEAANLMAMRGGLALRPRRALRRRGQRRQVPGGRGRLHAPARRAMLTHGGIGYAKEYHVERYLREMLIPRIAPISPQLILCYIAEKVLGLPKSVLSP